MKELEKDKMIVYGLANCDSTRKTLRWLESQNIKYILHDFNKAGISKSKLEDWCKRCGWEKLLNKRSSTWRGLTVKEQAEIIDSENAIRLMETKTSIIKRPVLESGNKLFIGFSETDFIKH